MNNNMFWRKFTSGEIAPENGLYVFACAGDNHILFEIHRLEKGEKLWKYYEGDFEHCNGWAIVIPEAYYYLPEYEPNCIEWMPFSSFEVDSKQLKIIAYSSGINIEYLLIERDCIIWHYGKTLLEDISESNFLSVTTLPIY